MKHCAFCGTQVDEDTVFCPECGRRVEQESVKPVEETYTQHKTDAYLGFGEDTHAGEAAADNKIFALIPYVGGIIGAILSVLAAKDSKFVMFHVKEALKSDILITLTALISAVLAFTFVVPIVGGIFVLVLAIVRIIGFVSACKGEMKEMPIVSKFNFLK